ncbi:MAG: glycosyltransferase, partial [Solirubrobacterales bacterium]|nr:glycosyltransferase [Solirubrobacterales bacterium]
MDGGVRSRRGTRALRHARRQGREGVRRPPPGPARPQAVALAAPVTIVVVSWNTRELLAACLDSLRPDVDAGLAEVCVVDNASDDGSADLAAHHAPWARVIASSSNLGFGPAVNLGAEGSTATWIAPANADIALHDGALAALLAAGGREPRAGVLAPRLRMLDGATQHSVHPFPRLSTTLALTAGLPVILPALGRRAALEGFWDPEVPRRVDWAHGAFLLVRRDAWEQIAGFDPNQWMYAEDLDLCWR